MNRDEYIREKELKALESIAKSLETIASYLTGTDEGEGRKPDLSSKYPGMEVSRL